MNQPIECTLNDDLPPDPAYCSAVSAGCGEDPIGSAPSHALYLFVEVALPWADQVEQSRLFPEALRRALQEAQESGARFRFLAFVPETPDTRMGYLRVMRFRRPDAPLSRYEKQEYVVPEDELHGLVSALLGGSKEEDSERYAKFRDHAGEAARDLFVCTHGSRDVCCGKFGYPLYKELRDRYAGGPHSPLRAWRTSHLGGHRYAPTAVDMPEGRYWARLAPRQLARLVERSGVVGELGWHCRGWGGIGPLEQVAEREILIEQGWDWLSYDKQSFITMEDATTAKVRIEYRKPGAATVEGAYTAQVRMSGTVPTGGCGREQGEAKQYTVEELTHSVE